VLGKNADPASIALPSQGRGAVLARPSSVTSWAARMPVALWLVGIVGLSTAVRIVIASQIPVPWLIPDELVYSELARSFAATGHFAVREEAFSPWAFGPLYPIVIAPVFRLASSIPQAYFIVRVLNCVLMSSAAVPAYFLARRLLDRRTALMVATLAVLVPSALYTVRVELESLAYPAFLFAALAVVSALERPGWRRELLALASIGVAVLARAQLIVLLPALVISIVLLPIAGERASGVLRRISRRLRTYPLTSLLVLGVTLGLAALLAVGHSTAEIVSGRAEAVGAADAIAVLKSFVLHLGVLDLYVGILPFAALLIVCRQAVGSGAPRELRAFCVFTASVSVLLAAVAARYLVAVYEGPYADHDEYVRVFDRYEFYAVPLFLIAFFVWARSGLPRRRGFGVLAAAAAGLVPLSFLWGGETWTQPDSLAFIPWDVLRLVAGSSALVYAVFLPGCAYLAYVLFRSRNVDWMVFLIAANFVGVGIFGQAVAYADSRTALRQGIGTGVDRAWIDSAVGREADVVALWSGFDRRGKAGWRALWQSELMNESVRRVYRLREELPYGLPGQRVRIRAGHLESAAGPLRAEYVLTDLDTPVAGARIAINRDVGLVVYRVGGVVRPQ
jgi:hypothetical protein